MASPCRRHRRINLSLPAVIDWAIDGIINLFRGSISSRLESAFRDVIRQQVPRVIEDFLWSAEFALEAFARKAAARGDAYLTTTTLGRVCHAMTLALFAINRRHLLIDKTALDEIDGFDARPDAFGRRVRSALGAPGTDDAQLTATLEDVAALFAESAALAGDRYTPRFRLRSA